MSSKLIKAFCTMSQNDSNKYVLGTRKMAHESHYHKINVNKQEVQVCSNDPIPVFLNEIREFHEMVKSIGDLP